MFDFEFYFRMNVFDHGASYMQLYNIDAMKTL